jgi:hypothetical protein
MILQRTPLTLLAILCLGASSAPADVITFAFTGTVTSEYQVNAMLPFGLGAPVVGSFTYDDSAPLNLVAGGQSYFSGTSVNIQSLVGGLYAYSQSYIVPIYPDVSPDENAVVIGPVRDADHQLFAIDTNSWDRMAEPNKHAGLYVDLIGTTGLLSSTTSLSGLNLDLSKLDWSQSTLSYTNSQPGPDPFSPMFDLSFTATLNTLSIVPEPTALTSMAIGLASLGLFVLGTRLLRHAIFRG